MGEILLGWSGSIATVTLSNPERRNALSVAMWKALREAFETLATDTAVRCVMVTGAGGHFAGGADIREFPDERSDTAAVRIYHEAIIAPALDAITRCPIPTLAAIEGVCVGGGLEIAARCDLRICADDAELGIPIARLGFPMAPDELSGLLELAGPAIARELLLEGRILTAAEAMTKGLVTRVVPAASLKSESQETAVRLTEGAPLAARLNKWLIQRLRGSASPLTAAERERAFSYAETQDHREGVLAFLEHRPPHFTGD